ncbi:hypothetical protein C8F01DRAFT_1134282 [Mycena amicta]|nr:hypothetical protein C8F01DRAFT_1134282 [Mycena amicta]
MLSHLPFELLEEITAHLDPNGVNAVRLASRGLRSVTAPAFYHVFTLKTNQLNRDSAIAFLETIARGDTEWPHYAREIVITGGEIKLVEGDIELDVPMDILRELFLAVLGLFDSVHMVVYDVWRCDRLPWLPSAIAETLNGHETFPLIEDLSIVVTMYSTIRLSLSGVSNLHSLKINTGGWQLPISDLSAIAQIVSQSPNLTCLHLRSHYECDFSPVWEALITPPRRQRQLRELATSAMSPALMRYLVSYSGSTSGSGLQSLEITGLCPPYDNTQSSLDASADEFFATVIPLHAHSLVRLTIQLHHHSRWSFSATRQEVISSLKSLRALRMAVNADDVLAGKPVLCTLLSTTTTLPQLISLGISCADSPPRESNNENRHWCGTNRVNAYLQTFSAVSQRVKDVLSSDGVGATAGWTHVRVGRHNNGERLTGVAASLLRLGSSMEIALQRRSVG